MCGGGPTSSQIQLQNEQMNFYNTLSQDYSTQFADQHNILTALTSADNPIVAAGPNQYGFSKPEDTALRTQAEEGTAQSFAQASKALGEQNAAAGGGNVAIGSGAQQQEKEQLSSATAQQQSAEDLGITTAGYQQGYNQWLAAGSALGNTAGMYNPAGFAGQATGAGGAAGTTANQIEQANAAASPFGVIGGILGGGLSAALGNPNIFGGGGGGGSSPSVTPGGGMTPWGQYE